MRVHGEVAAIYSYMRNPTPIDIDRPRAPSEDVRGDGRLAQRLAGEHDRLVARLKRCVPASPFAGGGCDRLALVGALVFGALGHLLGDGDSTSPTPPMSIGFIESLAHVERLRKSAPVHPHDLIADFKARVLDGADHAVIRARA